MPKYTLDDDVMKYAEYFKNTRRRERARLERNLSHVPRWQQLLAKISDTTPETVLEKRLAALQTLITDNGLTIKKSAGWSYSSTKEYNTTYRKGTVEIKNLMTQISIGPKGTVSVDVYKIPVEKDRYYYSPRAKDKVIRIYVGEETRVTNNVLRTLVNKT